MVSIIQTEKSTDYQAIANDVAQTLADSAIERDRLGVNIYITPD